ncbi:MAG: permease [Candidatus Dormibacteraceae bacterium]
MAIEILDAIGSSLWMAFFMFWETLWPLVFGFGLAGAVQAFVSRSDMQRVMGDHRPKSLAAASLFGVASSSCSYAATAMAKSLFQKGADFTTAMVFMLASTNLVVELGLVLWILIGWQFAISEYVGGVIMISLLALVSRFFFRPRLVEAARRRLEGGSGSTDHEHYGEGLEPHERWVDRQRSKAGWADAAAYTMADLAMLRKELLIGYLVAGFIAVLVPNEVWNVVLFRGHGLATPVENALVGPLIAVLSFVCSVGNVPLAAALWKGGISFGGVVSFIFADLITLPLILIYRKFYGFRLTLRLVVAFWLVMAAAGLITEGLFSLLGLIPGSHPTQVVQPYFEWNYTAFLNIAFLIIFAGQYWLYRNRQRFGGGTGYAIDPVCGMQVQTELAPASAEQDGRTHYFCSDRCHAHFLNDPDKFAQERSIDRP